MAQSDSNKTLTTVLTSGSPITGLISPAKIYTFALLLANEMLPPSAVTVLSSLYIFTYLLKMHFTLPRASVRYITIPVLLIMIGFAGSGDHEMYDVMKDGWYFLNPVLILLSGFFVMYETRELNGILKIIVAIGAVLAIVHVGRAIVHPASIFETTTKLYRQEVGEGSAITMLGLVILLFSHASDLQNKSRPKATLYLIMTAASVMSVLLSLSRSMWFSFIIFSITLKGWFSKRLLAVLLIFVFVSTALVSGNYILPHQAHGKQTILVRLANSINETIMSDYSSRSDINEYWRGYESYMGFKQYVGGNATDLLFGQGFGALIDLRIYIYLGGELFRFIPIMHNGYIYLLIKTGLLGLALYLLFIYRFIRLGNRIEKTHDRTLVFVGRFIKALSFVLLFTTFVIAGLFNKTYQVPFTFLLGTLLACAHLNRHQLPAT